MIIKLKTGRALHDHFLLYRPPIVAHCDRKRVLSSWAPYCRNVVPLEYQVEFSKVRSLSPRQFVERLSKDLRIKGVVAGTDVIFCCRFSIVLHHRAPSLSYLFLYNDR
jgi:hypothetical protein